MSNEVAEPKGLKLWFYVAITKDREDKKRRSNGEEDKEQADACGLVHTSESRGQDRCPDIALSPYTAPNFNRVSAPQLASATLIAAATSVRFSAFVCPLALE